jgi:hypothetical protein
MALRRCLRTDSCWASALDCTGIELLGPSIGDQSPFDEPLATRPSDQSNQRPRDERASAGRYASNEVAAVHYVVKQRHHPLLAKRTPLLRRSRPNSRLTICRRKPV